MDVLRLRRTSAATVEWMLAHLPLTGAAMVSLVEHPHAATAWVRCSGAAAVLVGTMLVAATRQVWHTERELYLALSRTLRSQPSPPVLGLVPVLLFAIPWGLAVTYRLRRQEGAARERTRAESGRSTPTPGGTSRRRG
ncbi:hypothetical protein [Kitasatospora sp. CB02891]|uniref:hypothetical protein n=1 Tax=Kitasatospora sp. CB02891 TaxID=2020329 RepID=UPI000C27F340|nr:hypothetical protein [Kitasatospora sp. CB02891]PJN25642.1 hypothetical protein CG736_14780 [Kitasatospora sp. CB02891]